MIPVVAYALCWPNDTKPLLFNTKELAEENRKWFTANYKRNSRGELRGDPFIVELVPNESV